MLSELTCRTARITRTRANIRPATAEHGPLRPVGQRQLFFDINDN